MVNLPWWVARRRRPVASALWL